MKHKGHLAICDVCGCKIYASDGILVSDKYSSQYGLLVCKRDLDVTNPQTYIRARRERPISNPRMVRPEPADQYYSNTNGDAVAASAPQHPSIYAAEASGVELLWLGPIYPGNRSITGYKIERESPVGGGFATLVSNTNSVAGYYKDTSVEASTQYNYRISAVNAAGAGAASDEIATTTGS